MSPVGVKAPVAGSYSSALLRETSTAAGVKTCWVPPAIRTLPVVRRVAVWK